MSNLTNPPTHCKHSPHSRLPAHAHVTERRSQVLLEEPTPWHMNGNLLEALVWITARQPLEHLQ